MQLEKEENNLRNETVSTQNSQHFSELLPNLIKSSFIRELLTVAGLEERAAVTWLAMRTWLRLFTSWWQGSVSCNPLQCGNGAPSLYSPWILKVCSQLVKLFWEMLGILGWRPYLEKVDHWDGFLSQSCPLHRSLILGCHNVSNRALPVRILCLPSRLPKEWYPWTVARRNPSSY